MKLGKYLYKYDDSIATRVPTIAKRVLIFLSNANFNHKCREPQVLPRKEKKRNIKIEFRRIRVDLCMDKDA